LIALKIFIQKMNGKININYFLYIILIIGLYGSLGNKVYISPIPSLASFLLLPFLFLVRKRAHKLTLFIIPYFLVTLFNIIIYNPNSFLSFDFYRYDGNFFISFLPILVFPFFYVKFDILKVINRFLIIAVILNLVLFLVGFTSIGRELHFMRSNELGRNFHGFFKAHNAAGGFFSFLTSIAAITVYKKPNLKNFILLFLSFIFLLDTGSRGSLLGFFIGILCYILYVWKGRVLISIVFVSLIISLTAVLYNTYGEYDKYKFSKQKETAEYIRATKGVIGAKKMNIYHRIYGFWPRCIDAFSHSPLFGIGYGGINDVPLEFSKKFALLNLNKQVEKPFNDQHGHNSYLHILSEQGLLGLFLFLFFWFSIYNFLVRNKKAILVRDVLLITFFNISIMSFTEHRITTPSNALPFVLLLCLYILFLNGEKYSKI
jgi:O-antigen ligase